MSLLRSLQRVYRTVLLGGAGRVAAAALLLVASLAAPGAAPILAAPAAAAPLAPQVCGPFSTLVNNNFDNGDHSLRGAVACATAGQTVTFSHYLVTFGTQTIILTSGEITITQSITIDGSGAPGMIVDAGNASRVFNITASGPVTLTALTLQHGSSDVGGAVFDNVSQPLVLNNVRVLSSTVVAGTGGGLFADGPLTLINSDFISDTSTSNGGGLVAGGAAVVTGGRFERDTCTSGGCEGGAVFGFASLTLSGTQFISNTSTSSGGGAYTQGAAVLTNGLFQGNQCHLANCNGGGLLATTLVLAGTQFIGNTAGDAGGGSGSGSGGGAYTLDAAVLANGLFQDNHCHAISCQGGGLFVSSSLTVSGTQFIGNSGNQNAGGAYVAGAAALTGGLFQGNQCFAQMNGCYGGGLFAAGGVALTSTQFISNTSTRIGGGAYVAGAAVLTGGLFQGNRCTVGTCQAGGLMVTGTLTLSGTEFIGNSSGFGGGGAVYAAGNTTLTHGLFQDNQCMDRFGGNHNCPGGALLATGTVLVTGSVFSGNHSAGIGGAVAVTGTGHLTLANVTLSGNLASVSGGGLYAGGASQASLYNVTVADNQAPSGGGVRAEPGITLGITNTVFSNNTADNCSGAIGAGTHNLEWPAPAACATAGPSAGFTTADPLLAPLALNPAGTTLTQALLPGSPARDHGDPVSCANSLVNNLDQRGAVRPDAGGEACDIGAYEAGAPDWLVFLPLVLK